MNGTVLRAAQRLAQPWKNGGGTTHEVAAFPPGAGMDDFLWRLSIATVAEEGAFSRFAGVDRLLAVLDGKLELGVDGMSSRVIEAGGPPFAFPGDAEAWGKPVGGPVTDLNAMVRRGRFDCEMLVLRRGEVLPTYACATVVVATAGIGLAQGGAGYTLGPLDAFYCCGGEISLDPGADGSTGYAARFRPLG